MDAIGKLDISWVQGYAGGRIDYITKDTVCFQCGNHIKFINEQGTERTLPSPGNGMSACATHNINKVIAIAETGLKPNIHILSYPDLQEIKKLEGGAELEYTMLVFSASNYLAAVTGVPEFELVIWDYVEGIQLTRVKLPHVTPKSLSFNPGNWRQLFLSTEDEMFIFSIEEAHTTHVIHKDRIRRPQNDGTRPPLDGDQDKEEAVSRASTRLQKVNFEIPLLAIAGLTKEDAALFSELQDKRLRAQPVCHVWHPSGNVLVGCKGGQLLRIDGDSHRVRMLRIAETIPTSEPSMVAHGRKTVSIIESIDGRADSILGTLSAGEGTMDSIALHKDGLFVGGKDGQLRLLTLTNESMKLKNSWNVGRPISSLAFATTFRHLALGCNTGQILVHNLDQPSEPAKELFDIHHGQFLDMTCVAPGSQHVATVRDNGEVQVWQLDNGHLAGAFSLRAQARCIGGSSLSRQLFVGTHTGQLYVLDASDFSKIRIVHRQKLHQAPIVSLRSDISGRFLFCAGADGKVLVMDARPTKAWDVHGFTTFPGDLLTMSVYGDTQAKTVRVVITTATANAQHNAADKLVTFEIKEKLFYNEDDAYNNKLRRDFRDESINKMVLDFASPSHGTAVTMQGVVFTLAHRSRKLEKISLPDESPAQAYQQASVLQGQESFEGHGLPGGVIQMSPHQKWLVSGGRDGQLQVRSVGALERWVSVRPHDYQTGGVRCLLLSMDGQNILSLGYDGTLACYKWNYTQFGVSKGEAASDFARKLETHQGLDAKTENDHLSQLPVWKPETPATASAPTEEPVDKEEVAKREAIQRGEVYATPTPTPAAGSTLLQVWEAEAIREEDKLYADMKKGLRAEIRDMRLTIQQMIKQNNASPDIEQLGHEEFDLDLEEQLKLKAEGEEQVNKLRDEIEMQNLAKQYLRELIKKECWDEMAVKGRSVLAFNSSLEVANYPMKERTREELLQLEVVQNQRRIEIDEAKLRKESQDVASRAATGEDDPAEQEEESEVKEAVAISGSLGAQYGGANELFYSQTELGTREQKINQIVLLQDATYRIREAFNKEFESVFQKRQQEFTKITEKNKRIRQILQDLSMLEEVVDPQWSDAEQPEFLFTVKDSEITVEKFLTPEQRAALEEQERLEEEARARARADNWRERGLDMMMGGVLQIKKEDELKKDVPIPKFMNEKAEDEWTDEEQKLAQEYHQKVKDLNEEREKYRKQLEGELKKLQLQIEEGRSAFDEALGQLFTRKVKTEMVLNQEELKIMRLKYSLLLEEEFDFHEAELHRELEHKKKCKTLSQEALTQARRATEAFRDQYERLVAEDRVLERNFRREFHDIPAAQSEQLARLFKKRPRGFKMGLTAETPIFDLKGGNPFADRPSTARQQAQSRRGLESALKDLNSLNNMPENVEPHIWERLCKYRQLKIDTELMIKQKAGVLADMTTFQQKRMDEDDQLRIDVDDLQIAIGKLREERLLFSSNLELQLVVKQGHVEVDQGAFIPDYTNSILLHRSVVEDLNYEIRKLGEGKIASMEEAKDFKKGIFQLEWEHEKMKMQMEDFRNKVRDINQFKVTREVQAFLNNEDYDSKKQQDINTLEQTIIMLKRHHEKSVAEKQQMIRELERSVKQREQDLGRIDKELEESNVTVNERRHIYEVNGTKEEADKRSDAGREQRYAEIVNRRKLVDLAKAQAQEVAVLRAEVERLRMRTFPALVQVER